MEWVIVAVIVGLAAFFVGRKFYRMFQKKGANEGGCGCTSCGVPKDACEQYFVFQDRPGHDRPAQVGLPQLHLPKERGDSKDG